MYVETKHDHHAGSALLVDALPEVRAGFVKKVYTLLGLQLLLTFGWALVTTTTSVRDAVVGAPYALVASNLAAVSLLCAIAAYKDHYPTNLSLLAAFTLCEAYSVGAVSALYSTYDDATFVLSGIATTIATFAALSAYVHSADGKTSSSSPRSR